ncbi:OmpA family protein [Chitinophaga horti]|uniref:OmpA family protein n=1 Tax=Chitinophaga horti TaxID=2920382 RepID=A0ABY6J5R3_9BACT|nr:OmpA family protein [Chitinophaga horti]UYQ93519.1 OmpA family protein [Chitinophaga horti]
MKLRILFTSVCFALLGGSASAQSVHYENAGKKAQQYFDDAITAAASYQYKQAISLLESALKAQPKFVDAYGQLGLTYVEMRQYQLAITTFDKLKQLDPEAIRPARIAYAKALAGLTRYEEALAAMNEYMATARTPSQTAIRLKGNYEFAVKAKQNPAPFEPRNLGDSINSKDPEYFPSLTIDDKTLVYTRRVEGRNEDFYVSRRDSLQWGRSRDMGEPVNTAFNEGAQNISQDGEMLVFTGCDFPNGRGSCDIYYSIKTAEGWQPPLNIGLAINTRDWESQPCLSPDRQTLYFVRATSDAGQDIFMSKRLPNGQWEQAQRLGPNINTRANESTPFIHADNQTLYFSSSGHPGFGGQDMFYSRRQADGSWGPAVNLGYPVNTVDEDASMVVAADGRTAYFASDRNDTRGALDIYSFELPAPARAQKTLYVRGFVYDAKTEKRLTAALELIDLQTGLHTATVNAGADGKYLVPLPLGKDYAFNVNRKGYLFYSDNFSLQASQDGQPFEKNIPLQPLEANAIVTLKNIFFETGKFTLREDSHTELDRLVTLLSDNASMKAEISGHTDNVGADKDNQQLSENRAKEVVKYLVSKGIAADRLSAKGYGESQPVATNDTEEGRAQNRRTVLKIISL